MFSANNLISTLTIWLAINNWNYAAV